MNEIVLSFNIATLILSMITLLAVGVCFFLIGYLCGSKQNHGVYNNSDGLSKSPDIFQNNKKQNLNISIDDTKIVTKINTDALEKKYDQLGEKKESKENIIDSINKLKNIKR
jgi:hypothetical protein